MRFALMGYARSGKDTVGRMIQDNLNGNTMLIAFGTALKESFHETFPRIPKEPKPREGYEIWGQMHREIQHDYWVEQLEKTVEANKIFEKNFVITDLRQPNEAEWCRRNDFIIVEVIASPALREKRSVGDKEFHSINESEKLIHTIKPDFQIYNDDSLEYLETQVKALLLLLEGGNNNA